jgi:hypothetical protein
MASQRSIHNESSGKSDLWVRKQLQPQKDDRNLCEIWGFHGGDYDDVKTCGSRKNWRFGGTYRLHHQGLKNKGARNVSNN